MARKCKKGYKIKNGSCQRNTLYLGFTEDDKKNAKRIVFTVIGTLSIYGIFYAIATLTGFLKINPWILLVVSIIIGLVSFRLGVRA